MLRLITSIVLCCCVAACGSSMKGPSVSSPQDLVIGTTYHRDGIDFTVSRYDPFVNVQSEPDLKGWLPNHVLRLICTIHNSNSQAWRVIPTIWDSSNNLPPIQADTTLVGEHQDTMDIIPQGTITRRLYYVDNSPATVTRNLSLAMTLVNGDGLFSDPPPPPIALITIQGWNGNVSQQQ